MSDVEQTVENLFDAIDKVYENTEIDSETGEKSVDLTEDEWDYVERCSENIWEIDVIDLEEAVGYALKEISERYLID